MQRLQAIDPVREGDLGRSGEGAAPTELLRGILASAPPRPPASVTPRPARPAGPRLLGRRAFVLAGAVAAIAAAFLIAAGSGKGPAGVAPEPALGAGLQRLVRVSPPILLTTPGWRVDRADEAFASEGSTQFSDGGRLRAELRWESVPLKTRVREIQAGGASLVTTAIALGSEARVYARPAESSDLLTAVALWGRGGRVLEFRSSVPDMPTFERRLAALRGVDKGTWLEALPKRVVKTEAGVSVSRTHGWEAVIFQPQSKKESK